MSDPSNANRPLILAVFAAIGASACCLGPLLLLTLGIGGAWIGNLTAMQPYSAYFTAATIIILALVFKKLYWVSPSCEQGSLCANPKVLNHQRIIFWLVTVFLIAMVTFPYYADYIID